MSYGKRLDAAIKMANSSRALVAKAAGVSVQAIGQCIREETEFLKVDGSAKAAALLDVDHYWLATGEGRPRPDRVWPFEFILPSQYKQLDPDIKRRIEGELAGEWLRVQSKNVSNS